MPAIWPYLLILANTQETNVVSRARFSRKLRQEPFSMGLLGEAFFDACVDLLSLLETLPRRARTASWRAGIIKTGPAFSLCDVT